MSHDINRSKIEARKKFINDGFLIVKQALSAAETLRARVEFDNIISRVNINPKDIFCNYYLPHRPDHGVLYDLYQRSPEFASLARNPVVIDAISSVYSPNFYLYENSLVYKPEGKSNAVPWHQDFMDCPNEPIKIIAWMALDDISVSNGCMWAVPGSHKLGFLKYYKVAGQTHHTRLVLDGVDLTDAIPLEMKSGDVLLFNQLILHSSNEVSEVTNRRAFRVSYQAMDISYTPRGTPIVMSIRSPDEVRVWNQERSADRSIKSRIKRAAHRLIDSI